MFHKATTRLTAHVLIVASALLGVLLAVATVRNLGREERLMRTFLLQEGLTLIRAFEAGARTSMMMTMMMNRGESSLDTLVRETTRSPEVAYIRVEDETGRVLASAGNLAARIPQVQVSRVLAATGPSTRLVRLRGGAGVFEVAKEFDPVAPWAREGRGDSMRARWRQFCDMDSQSGGAPCRQVIFVGLVTQQFDVARREAVRQSLILAGVLLLVGVGGLYGLFLSQRVRVARDTIENLELYTRDVIESLPEALVTLDARGRVDSLNRRGEELFGIREAEARGRPFSEVARIRGCDLGAEEAFGQEARDVPGECSLESGEALPVKVSASALRSRSGERVGTVLVLRDQRPIRAMEEQLERSRRLSALGQLAAGIAHEIRNPLGTLRGFAQYFGRRAGGDGVAEEYAGLMVSEIDRLNRSIEALLQFARPREAEFRHVDLGGLVTRAAKLAEGEAASRSLALRVEAPPEGARARADPDLLVQVLLNLLQNALEATKAGGEVRLGAAPAGREVRLWVEDTGRGLAPEERERMFDPFYTTRKTGTGLGLAVVHQVVEQHGGRIEVKSAQGRGTTVSVFLPGEGG